MDKESENYGNDAAPETRELASEQLPDHGRRRFSRSAIVGSAVLLSLGNRAAWGGATGGKVVGCMSITTLNSFNPTTGMFVSAPSGAIRPDHNEDLAAEIHRISDAPEFLGSDGRYSSCENPDTIDSICLIKGDCP